MSTCAAMPLPTSVDDLSVQLIYSEGSEKGGETLWMFCAIAMAPFTMGIPANQSLQCKSGFRSVTWIISNRINDALFPLTLETSELSLPIGDSVTASLLSAIEALVTKGDEDLALADLFKEKYGLLNVTFLPNEEAPKPYSSGLEVLTQLIKTGVVAMNMEAYDSGMLAPQGNWFLTFERAYELMPENADRADEIVAYVEQAVLTWHAKNSRKCEFEESDDSACAWSGLVKTMWMVRREISPSLMMGFHFKPLQFLALKCLDLQRKLVSWWRQVASSPIDSE